MRIALGSDFHLEFSDFHFKNEEKADGLILSGDIMIAEDLHRHPPGNPHNLKIELGSRQDHAYQFRDFLARCSGEFPWTVYVAGNHEFYHGKWPIESLQVLRDECARFPNIFFMENDCKVLGDFTFIGCTLWTDMNKGDPLTMYHGNGMMNDFTVIRNDQAGYTKLRPAHVAAQHRKSLEYIRTVIEGKFDEKFVVVGHHAPTLESIHPMYSHDKIMNGYFASDLSNFIIDHPQIKLWTHGHTHNPFDYMMGNTRIVCNPRGYPGEYCSLEYKIKYLDI